MVTRGDDVVHDEFSGSERIFQARIDNENEIYAEQPPQEGCATGTKMCVGK